MGDSRAAWALPPRNPASPSPTCRPSLLTHGLGPETTQMGGSPLCPQNAPEAGRLGAGRHAVMHPAPPREASHSTGGGGGPWAPCFISSLGQRWMACGQGRGPALGDHAAAVAAAETRAVAAGAAGAAAAVVGDVVPSAHGRPASVGQSLRPLPTAVWVAGLSPRLLPGAGPLGFRGLRARTPGQGLCL